LEGWLLGFFLKKGASVSAFRKRSLLPGKQPKYYREYLLACLNTAPHSVCWGFVAFPSKGRPEPLHLLATLGGHGPILI